MPDEQIPVAGMGADDVSLLKGLDGVLKSTDAASQAVKNAASELKVLAQRTGQYGVGGSAAREASGVMVANADREALYSRIVAAGGDPAEAAKYAGAATPTRTVETPPTAAPPQSATSTSGQTNQETFEYYRDYFGGQRGFSLRNLRKDVGQRVIEATDSPWGEQFYQSPEGEWVDEEGNLATSAALMAFMRREKIAGAARGFGQSLAKGSTMRAAGMGAAPGIIAKGAGIAGAALYAGKAAGNFFEDQRAANAQWQSIYGGSNLGATGQRLSQKLFGLSQFGFMDGDQAERLFRSVSETGLQGDERQGALDFAGRMYGELGMDVNQSVKLIQLAVATGNESLAGFAGAIRDVSESAVEAGVNAEKARELFIQNSQAMIGQFGGGIGTTQLAAAITAEQVGLGNELTGMNLGLTSEPLMRRIQGATGMDMGVLTQMASQDPGQFATLAIGQLQSSLPSYFKSATHYQQAQQLIRDGFAAGRDLTTITQQVIPLMIDPGAVFQMVRDTGAQPNTSMEAAMYIVSLVGDQINPEERIAEQEEEVKVQSIRNEADGYAEIGARNEWLQEHYLEKGGLFGTGMFGNARNQDLNQALRRHVSRTGQTEGLVGKIFEEGWTGAIQEVMIQTDDGPKVMSLSDAVGEYGDQINAGKAVIVGGDHAGQTIAEAVGGGHSDPTAASGTPADVGRGEDADAYMRKHGEVTLGLTPEARRALQPTHLSGGVSWDDYYTQTDPHRTQESYSTGNEGG